MANQHPELIVTLSNLMIYYDAGIVEVSTWEAMLLRDARDNALQFTSCSRKNELSRFPL